MTGERGVSPVYRAARVILNGLLSSDSTGVNSLASISVPDTVAITLISSLDRIMPVRSSPRADRHRPLACPGHRMARCSGSPACSLARNSRNMVDWLPSSRNMRFLFSFSDTPSESISVALSLTTRVVLLLLRVSACLLLPFCGPQLSTSGAGLRWLLAICSGNGNWRTQSRVHRSRPDGRYGLNHQRTSGRHVG